MNTAAFGIKTGRVFTVYACGIHAGPGVDTGTACPACARPNVWHKDGPVAQIEAMIEWLDHDLDREHIGKVQTNLRASADTLAGAVGEAERLRAAIEEYLLWEPGRAGHAAAHRALRTALEGGVEMPITTTEIPQ